MRNLSSSLIFEFTRLGVTTIVNRVAVVHAKSLIFFAFFVICLYFSLVSFPSKVEAAAQRLNWAVDPTGQVLSIQEPSFAGGLGYLYNFLPTNFSEATNSHTCYGGAAFVGTSTIETLDLIGGGLLGHPSQSGSADCTVPGNYYVLGSGSGELIDIYYQIYYDGVTVEVVSTDEPNTRTRVTRITDPDLFSITSSTTFNVDFDYINNQNEYTVNGYKISWTHTLSGKYQQVTGFLTSTSSATGTESISVTSNATGTVVMKVDLCELVDGGETVWTCTNMPEQQQFSIVSNDNIQTVTTTGYADVVYSAESCEFNWNPFAETTFIVSDCVAYLLRPSRATIQQFQTFSVMNYAPWSYPAQFVTVVKNLFTSNSNGSDGLTVDTGALGEFTFISQDIVAGIPFTPLLKSLLTAGIWFMAGFALYRKGLKVFDHQTT